MTGCLMIIPCTKSKIWDFEPHIGEVQAVCAYSGPEFVLSRQLALKYADRMVIFSAKHGFLDPWDIIPETYDVTFSRCDDPYIEVESLKQQAKTKGLLSFKHIIAVCNDNYQKRVREVFSYPEMIIKFPIKEDVKEEEFCMKLKELLHRDLMNYLPN